MFLLIEDRLLSLFSNLSFKGKVEDLNRLTRLWALNQPDAILSELKTLIKTGMLAIVAKLSNISSNDLLAKAAEIWSNFYSNILNMVVAALLPLEQSAVLNTPNEKFSLRNLILSFFKSFVIFPLRGRLQGFDMF